MSSFLLRRSIPTQAARAFSTTSARPSFAKLTLVGRLADQPELQATSSGQEIVKYAVGTSSGRGEKEKTSWFRVTSFLPEGPQRDFITGLSKGTLVYVEGDASISQYTDGEGKPRTSLNVIQQKLEVLSSKKQQESA